MSKHNWSSDFGWKTLSAAEKGRQNKLWQDNGDLKELFDLRFQMADSTPILRIGPLNLVQELFSVFSIRKSGLILEIQLMGWL